MHQCLEILHRYNGYHAGTRRHLNNLRASWESSTGMAATRLTARARAIVEIARTTISAGDGKFDEFPADGGGAVLQRQVEGGISSRSNARGNAHPTNGLHIDLNLSRVFSQEDAYLFEDAMLKAAKDFSTPLASVFSRVQAWKLLYISVGFMAA